MIPLYSSSLRAGFPSPATDYIESELDFNLLLVKNKPATYCLRVQGDSMINAGIFPDDILIVDRSINPKSNDIIIASINGEFTVKRFIKNKSLVYLEPANSEYDKIPIYDGMDFQIWGVVTYNIHKTLIRGQYGTSTN